jgi:RHS repeat-associated protein
MQAYKGLNTSTNAWTPVALDDYREAVSYDPNGNILGYYRRGAPEKGMFTNMDSLTYHYYSSTNRLHWVDDSVGTGNYTEDIDDQGSGNYTYDAIGNLKTDVSEGITDIRWTVYGKIDSIAKSSGGIRYTYDAAGNRITKTANNKTIIYVRDAQGNVLSIYEKPASEAIKQTEVHLYGSSRLGILSELTKGDSIIALTGGSARLSTFTRGEKFFELSNHLGNVLATITDKKLQHDDGSGGVDYYLADIASASDYAPFGMQLVGRKWNGGNYRYGFNGKEQDHETTSTTYDYGFRVYNPALGRFLSVDPLFKTYPFYTPYQFAGNMPIAAIDLDGLEAKVSFDYATVTKDRTAIEVKSSVSIKIQIINLSAIPDADLDLQNIALNLSSDLSNKLGGKFTATMNLPFIFKSKDNHVTGVETIKSPNENKDYSVTFNTYVSANVSDVNDVSKIDKDAWVFAIVDKINYQKDLDAAGLADTKGGRIAIGEAKYFDRSKAYKEGRQLTLHETLHLLGATDTYPPNSGFPGTQNNNNVMYSLSSENKRQLTPEQIVREIWISTIGVIGEIFKPEPYKQPESPNGKIPTQQQLKTFINENASAAKISNTP